MSVEQINFYSDNDSEADVEFKKDNSCIVIRIWSNANGIRKELDRSQAHLLKLFLDDFLNPRPKHVCEYCNKEHDSRVACPEYVEQKK